MMTTPNRNNSAVAATLSVEATIRALVSYPVIGNDDDSSTNGAAAAARRFPTAPSVSRGGGSARRTPPATPGAPAAPAVSSARPNRMLDTGAPPALPAIQNLSELMLETLTKASRAIAVTRRHAATSRAASRSAAAARDVAATAISSARTARSFPSPPRHAAHWPTPAAVEPYFTHVVDPRKTIADLRAERNAALRRKNASRFALPRSIEAAAQRAVCLGRQALDQEALVAKEVREELERRELEVRRRAARARRERLMRIAMRRGL